MWTNKHAHQKCNKGLHGLKRIKCGKTKCENFGMGLGKNPQVELWNMWKCTNQ
jgi:hypothetical protein